MEQRITVRIADREYVLMAPTPESEEYIRIALQRKFDAVMAEAATLKKDTDAYLDNIEK